MAITGTSTQAEIVAQYLDSLSYDINGSAAQAGQFIAACRALLVMHPADWQHSQNRITYQPKLWSDQLLAAQQWLSDNGSPETAGGVKHISFRDFRC